MKRTHPKLKFVRILVTLIVLVSIAPAQGGEGKIQWYKLYEGRKKAKLEKKPLIVDFYMPMKCHRCMAMESSLYSDPRVIEKLNRDFVPVRIDLSRELDFMEAGLGESHDYNHDCLLLFLDHRGKVVREPGGKKLCFTEFVTPESFLKYLEITRKWSMDKK